MITGYCTNVIGCSTTELKANGVVTCIACNFPDYFLPYPQNDKCLCKDKYELIGDRCV